MEQKKDKGRKFQCAKPFGAGISESNIIKTDRISRKKRTPALSNDSKQIEYIKKVNKNETIA